MAQQRQRVELNGGGSMIPANRKISAYLGIQRPDGAWVNLSHYLTQAEVELGDVSLVGTGNAGVDGRVRTLRFSLKQEGDSFSPRDKNSFWNTLNGEYSPLLWPNRKVRFDAIIDGVSYRLFEGYLGDSITADGSCECRDLSKRLQDCYIEEKRIYGSENGTPAEDVIQEILDDNLGEGEVELYCPVSPGFMVLTYELDYMSVWDAIQQVADQFGWFLGYRLVDGEFKLILMEPPRQKDTPDYVLNYEDDIYVQELEINDADVRNVVVVTYRDSETGQRATVTLEEETSINLFGRRAMQIEEADTSLIDTEEEAERFAQAALDDLHDLPAICRIDLPIFPQLDVFSTIQIHNPRISSTEDFYAVNSVRHTLDFAGGKFRTEVIAGGKVIGGHAIWLRKETRPGAKEPIKEEDIGPIDKIENKPIEIVDPSSGLKYSMDQWGFVAVDPNTEEVRPYVNRIAMGEASDGDFISLDFERTPQVKVVPRGLTTYNPDYSTAKQTLRVFASDISPEGFKVNCKLIVPGLETIYGQGDNLRNVGDYWISPYTYPNTTSFLVSIQAWFRYDIWNRMWNSAYFTYRLETQLLGSSIWEMVGEWTIGSREFNNNWFQTRVFVGAKTATHQWDTSGGQKRIKLTMVDRYSLDPGTGTMYWDEMYVRVNSWREVSDFVADTGDVSWLAIEGGGGDIG